MQGDGFSEQPERPDPPSIPGLEQFLLIGEGGFAEVWRAWQPEFNRRVAVKVLLHHDQGRLRRFQRECLAAGSVDHPNIVHVHAAGQTPDTHTPYLQMEYLRGSLDRRLAREGPLSWPRTIDLGIKLAGALATAHHHGILHRDIKPENILLDAFGEPKLGDFGIARLRGESLTDTTRYAHSPEHAPPEVVRVFWEGERPVDDEDVVRRGDVYSLASTLVTALLGHPPFTRAGDSAASLSKRILSEPAPDLRHEGVPGELCAVLERAMAKDPYDRYASAPEFGRALQDVQRQLGMAVTFLPFDEEQTSEHEVVRVAPSTARSGAPPPAWAGPAPSPPPPPASPPPTPSPAPPIVEPPPAPESGPAFEPPDGAAPARRGPAQVPARERRRAVSVLAGSAVLLAAVALVAVLWPRPATRLVPNVEGKPSDEATRLIRAAELQPVVVSEFSETGVPSGTVASQAPLQGRVKRSAPVRLTVSKGPPLVEVPDLGDKTEAEATDLLVGRGLKPGSVSARNDNQGPAGKVVDWGHRGERVAKGTGIDLTVSRPVPPPPAPSLLRAGPLAPGRYTSDAFTPKVVVSAMDGWQVDEAASPDLIALSRADRPTSKVSIVRVQRVYNPASPNLNQPELATVEDAFNSIQDVRDLSGGLADWLLRHPRRIAGRGAITDTSRGGRTGRQVDAQFRPFDYEGCGSSPSQCVPLFQLYGKDGATSSFAKVGSEVTRFEVFDLIPGVKLVVATSALAADFDAFVNQAPSLLAIEQFDFTDRISTPRVRTSVNPSNENEPVSLVAEVNEPCAGGRVVFSVNSVKDHKVVGTAGVVNGRATLDGVSFQGRGGRARVLAEYDGTDCARGISAPLIQSVS